MKILRKFATLLVSSVLTISIALGATIPGVVNAATTFTTGSHNYKGYNQYWDAPAYTSMIKTSDGYMVVLGNNSGIVAIYYDNNYNYKSFKSISVDYNQWGGFYSDGNYYYLFTGKNNTNHSNSVECYRLTKFDKNWNKLGQVGVSNCNTAIPFDAGNVEFEHYGNNIYIRTTCEMYSGHQANITFQFNTANMTLAGFTNIDSTMQYHDNNGYSSHSFHVGLALDGTNLIAADHGDCYPREMTVTKCTPNLLTGEFYSDYFTKRSTVYNVFTIGSTYSAAQNETRCMLGGLEASSTSYLTVGTSVKQNNYSATNVQNVFIGVTNKSTGQTTLKWLTNFTGTSTNNNPTNPFIVKINDGKFAVIWSNHNNDTVYYAFVDANGNTIGSVNSMPGALSDCQPIVDGSKITWYASSGSVTVNGGSISAAGGRFYSIFANPEAQKNAIGEFVDRLYFTCLNRTADETGKATWVNLLFSGQMSGSQAASGFIFSPEFKALNLCNDCYVDRLYAAFLGRAADPQGKATWVNLLNSGKSREEVFNGFALSGEFASLCNNYGITLGTGIPVIPNGTVPTGPCVQCQQKVVISEFVTRLYTVALGRTPDDSASTWVNALSNHTMSGSGVAMGFIFSAEYTNKNLTNEAYVESLYLTLFDRMADPAGKQTWVDMLNSGSSRLNVFYGFTGSQEFAALCARYGILQN